MKPNATSISCRRVLVVDDNLSIHDDLRKILCPTAAANKAIDAKEAALFGETTEPKRVILAPDGISFEMDSAHQGQEALGLVRAAVREGRPYMMCFMDVRMPPGWDGIETTARIWEVDPRIQIVVATAYSDYTCGQMTEKLGLTDKYVILKKPFDAIEALQLANSCTEKWLIERQAEERECKLQESERRYHLLAEDLERRVAERTTELADARLRLEHLFRSSPAIIYSLKTNDHDLVTFISHNVEVVLGFHPAVFVENPRFWTQHVHPDDAAALREHRFHLMRGEYHAAEYRFRHRDGSYRWLHDEARVIRDGRDAPVEIVGSCADITERKETEVALQLAHDRTQQYLDIVGTILVGLSGDRTISLINHWGCELLGYDRGYLLGKNWFDLALPERERDKVGKAFNRLMAGEPDGGECEEITVVTRVGKERLITWHATPVRDAEGKIVGTLSSGEDITERKQTDAALRASEEAYRLLAENSTDVIWVLDLETQRFRYVSPSVERLLGFTAEEVMAQDMSASLTPESMDYVMRALPERIAKFREGQSSVFTDEIEQPCKDGSTVWTETTTRYRTNPETGHLEVNGASRNISERKRAEGAMHLQTSALKAAANGIVITDVTGQILWVNPAFTRLTGYAAAEVIGKTPAALKSSFHDKAFYESMWSTIRSGNVWQGELVNRRKDGSHYYEEMTITPVLDQSGAIQNFVAVKQDVSQRKRTEAALRDSEEQFRAMFEMASVGIAQADPRTGRWLRVNEKMCAITGYPAAEMLAMQVSDITHPDDHARDWEAFQRVVRGEAPDYRIEKRYLRKDGETAWVNVNMTVIRDSAGQPARTVATIEDITDRKLSGELLAYERDLLRTLMDNSTDLIYFKDLQSRFLRCSQTMVEQFGFTKMEELAGKTDFDCFTEEHARPAYEDEQEIIRTGKPIINKLEKETYADGRVSWVLTTKMPWRDKDGQIIGTFGVSKNVTALKEAESKLAHEEALFRTLLDGVPDFIYFKDAQCRYTRINASQARLLGLRDPAEAVGKSDMDLFPSRHWRQTFVDEQRICVTGEAMLDVQEKIQSCDGKTLWISSTKVPLRDSGGNITGLVGVSRDITERVRQELERSAIESRYQTLFETAGNAIITLGGAGYLDCNTATLKMFGCTSKSEFVSAHPADFSPPAQPDGTDSKTAVNLRIMDAFKRGTNRFEWVHRRRNGEDFPAEVALTALSIGDQRVLQATVRDLTEAKKGEKERQLMEVQLRQAQKLESVGQLAAGIAHEINTPTQYVGDNTRFLKDSFESIAKVLGVYDELLRAAKGNSVTPELLAKVEECLAAGDLAYLFEQIPAAIRETLEGIERVTRIVRAMKEFSHPGGKEKAVSDLNKAIETTTTVARNEWKYVADLELDLDPALPSVPCFLGEFNQCILNLVVNAAHAIGDVVKRNPGTKGRITVRTRRDGDDVEVRVSDTGTGIPEAARPRIFEPFFTTKDVGKGTGQGLSIIYGSIVKKHGGAVSFETETGRGTTFILRLPIAPQNGAAEMRNTGSCPAAILTPETHTA